MTHAQDDGGVPKRYGQVARRYAESEMVAPRRQTEQLRAEAQRLRSALESIEAAQPRSDDLVGLLDLNESLRSIAREALSRPQDAEGS